MDYYYNENYEQLDYEAEDNTNYGAEDGNPQEDSDYFDPNEAYEEALDSDNLQVAPDVPVVDFRNFVNLCPEHGNEVSAECLHCQKLEQIVSPEMLRQMGVKVSGSESSIPEASSWITQAKPVKKPTLVLDKTAYEVAKSVFFAPPMSKTKYEEIVKDHLMVSPEVNHELTKNLHLEKILTPHVDRNLQDMKNLLTRHSKDNRLILRPVFLAVSRLFEAISSLRKKGSGVGIVFTAPSPMKSMVGPSDVEDNLAYDSAENIFPLPDLNDLLDGLKDLTKEDKETFEKNMGVFMTILRKYKTGVQKCEVDVLSVKLTF